MPEPLEEWEWGEDDTPRDVPTVDLTERTVIGVLLGPDGEPLSVQLDRPPVTGYAAWLYESRLAEWPAVEVAWGEES